jgi:hypothetical protein
VAQVDQREEVVYAAAAAAVAAGAAPLQAVQHVHISGKAVVYKPLAPQQMTHWRKEFAQPFVIAAPADDGETPSCELHLSIASVLGDSDTAL